MAEREPMRMEPGRKHTYICATDNWYTEEVEVSIAAKPFARGGMRACHKCIEKLLEPSGQTFSIESVAKFSMIHQGRAAKESAFADAKMQMVAEYYGQQFNKRSPAGQKVSFVVAQVLELPSRDERSGRWASLEPMLQGEYLKFNNNAGAVLGGSLAQAFSHFSLEESNGDLLICDIQGVGGSLFTDPQIHTRSGRGYGDGNLGERGIDRFKASHKCSDLCGQLKLPKLEGHKAAQNLGRHGGMPMGGMGGVGGVGGMGGQMIGGPGMSIGLHGMLEQMMQRLMGGQLDGMHIAERRHGPGGQRGPIHGGGGGGQRAAGGAAAQEQRALNAALRKSREEQEHLDLQRALADSVATQRQPQRQPPVRAAGYRPR